LVLPNSGKKKISSNYTSPLKLFEYMVSKRPIIASDLPSIRDVLNDDNSYLVAPDDCVALGAGINKILRNKKLSDKISQNSYNDVKNYTWHDRIGLIIDFIKK